MSLSPSLISPPLPRRAVLVGAVSLAGATAATGQTPAKNNASDPRVLRVEKLIADLKAAITAEIELEGREGYADAIKVAEAAERALQAETDAILAEPPRSLLDLALRARLVEYWNDRMADFLTDQDRTAHDLVRSVLVIAGLTPAPRQQKIIETIPALIEALGGPHAVADHYGVSSSQVVEWGRKDFIPTGWHHRFATRARKRGFQLSPDLFS